MTQARARELLDKAIQTAGGLQGVADELGCSVGFVSYLRKGEKRPSLDMAAKIERLYGIPAAAWADHKAA